MRKKLLLLTLLATVAIGVYTTHDTSPPSTASPVTITSAGALNSHIKLDRIIIGTSTSSALSPQLVGDICIRIEKAKVPEPQMWPAFLFLPTRQRAKPVIASKSPLLEPDAGSVAMISTPVMIDLSSNRPEPLSHQS